MKWRCSNRQQSDTNKNPNSGKLCVKGSDPKCTCKIVGIYGAPNEDMWVIERLAARTCFLGNCMKQSIIGGDLNLPQVDWKGITEGTSVTQTFINRLVWDNGYTQVVGKLT